MKDHRKLFVFGTVIVLALAFAVIAAAKTFDGSKKIKLNRDSVYYDVVNDAGDQGNFIFTFHVPERDQQGNTTGKTAYCIVYKDHSGKAVMGGMWCRDDATH